MILKRRLSFVFKAIKKGLIFTSNLVFKKPCNLNKIRLCCDFWKAKWTADIIKLWTWIAYGCIVSCTTSRLRGACRSAWTADIWEDTVVGWVILKASAIVLRPTGYVLIIESIQIHFHFGNRKISRRVLFLKRAMVGKNYETELR